MTYRRYVALGDSSTEGMDDPDHQGGFRGWANRLAENIALSQGSLLYANLAVRGRRTRQIRDQQLAAGLALKPDLATLFCGTNDVVSRSFDCETVLAEIEEMQRALIGSGAVLLTFTLPDLVPVMPLARLFSARIAAFNEGLREASRATGAVLVDFAQHSVASDPRLWSEDRLHANSLGHARIAAALTHALAVPGADSAWMNPLPPVIPPSMARRIRSEAIWVIRYLGPWIARHARGRSSGDNVTAKRPQLLPVEVETE